MCRRGRARFACATASRSALSSEFPTGARAPSESITTLLIGEFSAVRNVSSNVPSLTRFRGSGRHRQSSWQRSGGKAEGSATVAVVSLPTEFGGSDAATSLSAAADRCPASECSGHGNACSCSSVLFEIVRFGSSFERLFNQSAATTKQVFRQRRRSRHVRRPTSFRQRCLGH
jgi:hypothetical protein